ncbi:MAG: chemoreceptor glutamine deamidase CheD [Acidiferrobacterales bacterium]|nr:chemoreceptor glutamine deamidase CheD [Acidiferrobacterales bacterium]
MSAEYQQTCLVVPEQFRHVARQWDNAHELCSARILPGEYYVTSYDEVIATVLGSCVSACIRDPESGVGGMNHFMLPGNEGTQTKLWAGQETLQTRYGVEAMETLIEEILKLGSRPEHLELKLFGGGKVLSMETNNVGQRNITFVKDYVKKQGLEVVAEDLGGPHPRKILYFPKTGKVMVKHLRSLQIQTIANQEKVYELSIGNARKS